MSDTTKEAIYFDDSDKKDEDKQQETTKTCAYCKWNYCYTFSDGVAKIVCNYCPSSSLKLPDDWCSKFEVKE